MPWTDSSTVCCHCVLLVANVVSRLVVMFRIISIINNMWICKISLNPIFVIFCSKKFYLSVLLALYHTSLANHKIVIWRLCGWWQLWVVKNCIKTIAYSCCTFLPAECFQHTTLHPHNVSSFYSNIVQYRFSHPTLCIYYSKSDRRT